MSLYIISFVFRFWDFQDFLLLDCDSNVVFFLLLFLCCFYTFSFTWTVHTFLLFYNSFVSKCYSYFLQMFIIFFFSSVAFFFSLLANLEKSNRKLCKELWLLLPSAPVFFSVLRTKIIKQYFSFELWHVDVWIYIHFLFSWLAIQLCFYTRWLVSLSHCMVFCVLVGQTADRLQTIVSQTKA